MKIIKGDSVKVIRGKDKGKTGKVEVVVVKTGKLLIPGINEYKRHRKGSAQGQRSEIITITKPLVVSNVMLVCPRCHKITRVGYVMEGTDKKRVCKKCKNRF